MIFIQGDHNNWYSARKWQADKFIEVMDFGTMKSMGMPSPREETDPFSTGWIPIQIHYPERLGTVLSGKYDNRKTKGS